MRQPQGQAQRHTCRRWGNRSNVQPVVVNGLRADAHAEDAWRGDVGGVAHQQFCRIARARAARDESMPWEYG